MTYPNIPRQNYGQPQNNGGYRKRVGGFEDSNQFNNNQFNDEFNNSVQLHLNTRLSYVLGQSRAAQHRRISNVIHRYGLLLGDVVPKLREQFSELEFAVITWAITDSNTEHMNSRTFVGLMSSMVAQRRQDGLLNNVNEAELDALEDKLATISLLEELALLDLVEQRLAKTPQSAV